jgi:hypothetical protein
MNLQTKFSKGFRKQIPSHYAMSDLFSAILIVLFPTSGKANKSTKKLRELEPNLTSFLYISL